MANTLRCKIPHKKAFFAVLTDERYRHSSQPAERAVIAAHVPWTRVVRDEDDRATDGARSAEYLRRKREQFVLKPNDEYGGTGVTLGWETDESDVGRGDRARAARIRDARAGSRRSGSRSAARSFPICETTAIVERDMLVDFAPYLFRGRLAGFLTRLSATGLANVTSGGGQVPGLCRRSKGSAVIEGPTDRREPVFGPFSPELEPAARATPSRSAWPSSPASAWR